MFFSLLLAVLLTINNLPILMFITIAWKEIAFYSSGLQIGNCYVPEMTSLGQMKLTVLPWSLLFLPPVFMQVIRICPEIQVHSLLGQG